MIIVTQFHLKHFNKIVKSCETDYEEISRYSLPRSLDFQENLENLETRCKNIGGSSGAFFYYTYDKQYILKTITSDELLAFDSIIEEYTERITSEVPSYIARILGLFKIKVNRANEVFVILMENLSSMLENPLVFDMKGSSSDRRATESVYRGLEDLPKMKVYKDSDFFSTISGFDISNSEAAEVMKAVKLDIEMLERHYIMDYSLLLLIEDVRYLKRSMIMQKNYLVSGRYVICFGIIDYLQAYNTKKKLENRYKSWKHNLRGTISAIPPKPYRKRFLQMVKSVFVVNAVN